MNGFIGIDPGVQGALALLHPDPVRAPQLVDIPTFPSGGKRLYDVAGMKDILRTFLEIHTPLQAVLERSQAMPKQGVTSTFTIGYGFGLWVGMLAALEIPYTIVRAVSWKKDMLAGTAKDKPASVLRAKQLFPAIARELTRVKDHNRAEALLLAAWGARQYSPTPLFGASAPQES